MNNKGFGDYVDGFMFIIMFNFDFELLGCEVEDDFIVSLGDLNEGMLLVVLEYVVIGLCFEVVMLNGVVDVKVLCSN